MYENVPFGCKAFTGGLAKVMMATPSCPTSIVALGPMFGSVSQSTFVCHICLMVFLVRGKIWERQAYRYVLNIQAGMHDLALSVHVFVAPSPNTTLVICGRSRMSAVGMGPKVMFASNPLDT